MKPLSGLILALLTLALHAPAQEPTKPDQTRKGPPEFDYDAVPANRDVHVPEGFRGEVHPLLHGEGRVAVEAHWKPTLAEEKRGGIKLGVIDNQTAPEYSIPPRLVKLLTESTPEQERVVYGPRAFSIFLPEEIGEPGQMWRIEPEKAAAFLRQFHSTVSTAFDSYHQEYGRRPGPAGAFGILRAVSPDFLDIAFRVHAEFVLSEGQLVYTPACFLGHMVVDRHAGEVTYFDLGVPTELPVNLNILVTFALPDIRPRKKVTNIVFEHVSPMKLVGGDEAKVAAIEWQSQIEPADAQQRLKSAFYKFMDIHWVRPENMLAKAQAEDRPVMLIVLTSPLEDQSC